MTFELLVAGSLLKRFALLVINLAVTVSWHDWALLVGVAKFVSSLVLLDLEVFNVRILLPLSHAIL